MDIGEWELLGIRDLHQAGQGDGQAWGSFLACLVRRFICVCLGELSE